MAQGGTPLVGVPDVKRPSVRKRLQEFFTFSRFRRSRPRHDAAKSRADSSRQEVTSVGQAEPVSQSRHIGQVNDVRNKVKVSEDPKDALLRQYQTEIERLKKLLEEGGNSEVRTKVLSKQKLAEAQRQSEAERRKLELRRGLAEAEKRKIKDDLATKEAALAAASNEHRELLRLLQTMEKKVVVGGENLLEKAEEQERLLEESAKELEQRNSAVKKLKLELEKKEVERLDMEERCSGVREAAAANATKLMKVWAMYIQTKAEIANRQHDHQHEIRGLLESVRKLSQELRLLVLVIDQYIPPEFQELIEQNVHWNEDVGEWRLKYVAYTGNNMRNQISSSDDDNNDDDKSAEPDSSLKYLKYRPAASVGLAEQQQRSRNRRSDDSFASNRTSGRKVTSSRADDHWLTCDLH